jgi:pimeloyl-ACP methyl ester carboxylesterase
VSTFVLVPGAWLGGWCWRAVIPPLRAAGHRVFAPTLTGLAERAHLLTRATGLATHVRDVIDVLVASDLREVILVGHSYGGTVVSDVAGRVPERLGCLAFLDASVPLDGQSNNDALPRDLVERIHDDARRAGDGWLLPPPPVHDWGLDPEMQGWVRGRLAPHPLKSLEDPVALPPGALHPSRRAFLRTSSPSSFYQRFLERARDDGWYWRELAGGHFAMLTAPEVVAEALLELARVCARRETGSKAG